MATVIDCVDTDRQEVKVACLEDISRVISFGRVRSVARPKKGVFFNVFGRDDKTLIYESTAFFTSGFCKSLFNQASLYLPKATAPWYKKLQKEIIRIFAERVNLQEELKNFMPGVDASGFQSDYLAELEEKEGGFLNFDKDSLCVHVEDGRLISERVGDMVSKKSLPKAGLFKCRVKIIGIFLGMFLYIYRIFYV